MRLRRVDAERFVACAGNREVAARVSYKSVLQECPVRVSHKSVLQECPTRASYKSVP